MAQDYKICRLCLSKTKIYYNLTEDMNAIMLESVTAIKLEPLNNFETPVMCHKCRLNLRLTYVIQQNMIKAYAEFEQMLNSLEFSLTIKQEPDCNFPEIVIKQESPKLTKPKNVFSCNICRRDFNLKSSLQRHCKTKHPEDTLKTVSKFPSGGGREYVISKKVKYGDSMIYSCKFCAKTFQSSSSLYKHTYRNHYEIKNAPAVDNKDDRIGFQCDICSRSYMSPSALKSHWNTNHKKKTCAVCKKMFTLSNYYKHVETHTNQPRRICDICGNSASSKESLRSHIRRYHLKKAKVYKCDKCGKVFNGKLVLYSHEKSIHGGEPTEVCEICGKKFFNLNSLRNHRNRIHLKTKKFTCEFCNKNFSGPNALNTHKRQHTNETPYKCHLCGEGFRQRVSLRTHMSSKHNIEVEKNVACEVCGRKFMSDFALMTHKRVHNKGS